MYLTNIWKRITCVRKWHVKNLTTWENFTCESPVNVKKWTWRQKTACLYSTCDISVIFLSNTKYYYMCLLVNYRAVYAAMDHFCCHDTYVFYLLVIFSTFSTSTDNCLCWFLPSCTVLLSCLVSVHCPEYLLYIFPSSHTVMYLCFI